MAAQQLNNPNAGAAQVEYLAVEPADIPKITGVGRGHWSREDADEWCRWPAACACPLCACGCDMCLWAREHRGLAPPPAEWIALWVETHEWAVIRARLRNDPARENGVIIERRGNARR